MNRPAKLAPEAWNLLQKIPQRQPRRWSSVAENRLGLRERLVGPSGVVGVVAVRDLEIVGRAIVPLRLYHPAEGFVLPVLVYAHGGGWALGDLDTHDGICRAIASNAGCAVVSVGYRQPPESPYPAAWHDVQDALQAVVNESSRFGVDPRRVALGGDSAGGQLAAATALWAPSAGIKLRHMLLLMPDTDNHPELWASTKEFAEGYGMFPDDQIWYYEQYFGSEWRAAQGDGVSPLNANLENLPETTVVTAECDPVRDEGEEFARRLAQASVPVELRRYDGMFHPFILFRELKAARDSERYVAARLQEALK